MHIYEIDEAMIGAASPTPAQVATALNALLVKERIAIEARPVSGTYNGARLCPCDECAEAGDYARQELPEWMWLKALAAAAAEGKAT